MPRIFTWHAYNYPLKLFSFYQPHASGQPTYFTGIITPWEGADVSGRLRHDHIVAAWQARTAALRSSTRCCRWRSSAASRRPRTHRQAEPGEHVAFGPEIERAAPQGDDREKQQPAYDESVHLASRTEQRPLIAAHRR